MKKKLIILILASAPNITFGQILNADFETPLTNTDTAWFGQDQIVDGDTTFNSGGIIFENNYNAAWQSFTGWAYSNHGDVSTPGYGNQFSSITGSGVNGSAQFGLCYATGNQRAFYETTTTQPFSGAYFCNSTYSYLSMLNGDSFAKRFGDSTDASGMVDGTNGEDWFLLTIYGLGMDSLKTGDSVNFYLADYRFSDSSLDYIVDEWTYVDLTVLGPVHGLDFKLSSSDNASWGMNTPAYFTMDNLSSGTAFLAENKSNFNFDVFPNPASNAVTISNSRSASVQIIDLSGKVVYSKTIIAGQTEISINHLKTGAYVVQLVTNGSVQNKKLIKK